MKHKIIIKNGILVAPAELKLSSDEIASVGVLLETFTGSIEISGDTVKFTEQCEVSKEEISGIFGLIDR